MPSEDSLPNTPRAVSSAFSVSPASTSWNSTSHSIRLHHSLPENNFWNACITRISKKLSNRTSASAVIAESINYEAQDFLAEERSKYCLYGSKKKQVQV